MGLGMPEMLVIFFIIVLLFGAKKLPDLARGLGKGLKEFKQATRDDDPDEIEEPKKSSKSAERNE